MDLGALETRWIYTGLIGVVAAERLGELVISLRNERRLRARGAVEAGAGHFPVMAALHSALLASCLAEVWLLDRPFVPLLAAAMALLLAATMALRYWVIATLDGRWTTRVLVLPDEPAVTGGPYRWLRHPNYLAVIVEIAALPLLHGAWLTALLFSLANGWLLAVRVRTEEAALIDAGGYEALRNQPRWLPGGGPHRASHRQADGER
jgi:methyltransferase